MTGPRLPLALKIAYTIWFVLWIPSYWLFNGPENFLWLCDVGNFVLLLALWREDRLWLSALAVGVLLIQTAWILDFFVALGAGWHPIGGTEYMFEPADPLWVRGCSLFHVWVLPLLFACLRRLGYDRRAPLAWTALAWLVLPLTFVVTNPSRNINWLHQVFGVEQVLLPPLGWLLFCMVAYPVVLFWPAHLLLRRWFRPQPIPTGEPAWLTPAAR